MISDDLSSLFGGGQPGVRFRQGTVLAWDSNTGENTIDLAGGLLTDVPILNTGEAVALKAGHVVGMLGQGKSWFIVGRITKPNSPDFAGASVAFGSAGQQAFNFPVTQAEAVIAFSDDLVVPDWADEAIVFVGGQMSATNTNAGNDFLYFEVGAIGGSGGSAPANAPAGGLSFAAAVSRNHITGLSGGDVLRVDATASSQVANWATRPGNAVFLHAIAIYKSNV